MTNRLHTLTRIGRLLGVLALGATTMASDCDQPESVDERSAVTAIEPASRVDTTYALDTLAYRGPIVRGTSGVALSDFEVRWETSRAAVARLLDPPVQRYAGTFTDTEGRPLMRVEVVRDGDAVVTMTPLNVNFVNGVTQRFTATIVGLANRPTILDVQSVYNLRVGDTVSLAASPRGSSPGVFTTGSVVWTVANAAVAQLSAAPSPGYTPEVRNPATTGPVDRVGIRALAVGTTTLRVVYTGNGGVRLERTVTVNVTGNAARVQIDRALTRQTLVANDVSAIFASVLDAAGNRVDPSTLRFVSRDSIALPIRPAVTGCPSSTDPSQCAALVDANSGEIVRRGGVVRGWVVATAGAAAPDSVLLTVYPAVASLAVSPPTATIALGGSADFTVIARDASRNAIPAEAFPLPIALQAAPGNPSNVTLQLSTAGKPPAVTNVAVLAVPPGPATTNVQLIATRSFTGGVLEARATVTGRAVDRVVVTPATATHRIGTAGVTFTAQLLDAAGRTVTDPTIRPAWTTADSNVATVGGTTTERTAVVSGLRAGRTDVIATAQGVTGRASLEVSGALVTPTIAVTPVDLPLEVGQRGTLTAAVGNVATPSAVDWVSRDPSVASITPSGLTTSVTAASVGTTYIVASYTAAGTTVRDSARVRVSAVPSRVRYLVIEPRAAEITAPASIQYRVNLFDSAGTRVTAEAGGVVRYTSSNTGIARIDSTTGVATGVSGGTTLVRATYSFNGQSILSDTETLLVYPPTAGHLGSVEISTGGDVREVRVGQEFVFQVIVRDVNGAQIRSGAAGFAVGPLTSPYVDVTRATEFGEGYFYRVRGKAATPSVAASPAAVLLRADVTGAGAAIPIVVRP